MLSGVEVKSTEVCVDSQEREGALSEVARMARWEKVRARVWRFYDSGKFWDD